MTDQADFFVYENWTHKRARIHQGVCRYCNNGKGWQPVDSGANGKWHGPFPTRASAFRKLKELDYPDMHDCQVCMP